MKDALEDALLAHLVSDFRDEADDRMEHLGRLIDTLANRSKGKQGADEPLSDQTLWAIRREVHCLKGIASSFGFPGVSMVAHRFENFIDALEGDLSGEALHAFSKYMNALTRLIDGHQSDQDELARMLQALPAPGTRSKDESTARKAAIIVVTPSRVMSRLVASHLAEFKVSPTFCHDPIEAIGHVLRTKPDLLIASAVMEPLSGRDLLKGLRAMSATANLPVALLTSSDEEEERIAAETPHVAVVRSGQRFEADFRALTKRYSIGAR
jgi:chemotaxis protein histidine kinase CheA